jgi:ketosteroid isomerase-like protein
MTIRRSWLQLAALVVCLLPLTSMADTSEVDEITQLLEEFLAAADQQAAHEQFWADDLVYTSSTGQRFGKADILLGFADDTEGAEESDAAPAMTYFGEEVDVRLYGNTAIVAFKLVGQPADGSDAQYYYNTGTFLKRDGAWQVVAWQATKIPPDVYQ